MLWLFDALSDLNDPDHQTVIEYRVKPKEEPRKEISPDQKFRAREYSKDKDNKEKIDVGAIRVLDRDEVERICPHLEYLQDLTDEVVSHLDQRLPEDKRGAVFGSESHFLLKQIIDNKKDPNLKAEESYYRVLDNFREKLIDPEKYGKPAPYGAKYTHRLDAYGYEPPEKTVCVYNFRIGETRWSLRSMYEVAQTAIRNFQQAERVVLVQIKPTVPVYKRRQ